MLVTRKKHMVSFKTSCSNTQKNSLFQGEFAVKLEISNVSQLDKGSYKLVAKNEKGEATSQQVEITDIPEEKGDKPQIIKHFRSLVRIINNNSFLSRLQSVAKFYIFLHVH